MTGMQPQGPMSPYLASMGPNTPTTPQEMLETANGMADEMPGRRYRRCELSYVAEPATA